jgi:glucose/arabinose dehydrogenase
MLSNMNPKRILLGYALLLGIIFPASAQPQQQRIERMEGYLATPEQLEFDESLLKQLRLPAEFQINVFANDLGNPRNLAIASDGTIYVTRRDEGDIIALRDTNKDGRADTQETVASGFPYLNGITIRQNRLYFVTDRELYAANLQQGGKISRPQQLMKEFCQKTQPPALTYTAHSAPLAMTFYTVSQFPTQYRNDAFVTMRGSWNRNPPVGYKVVRLRYENGKPVAFEDFITGFLNQEKMTQFGRPVSIATAPDGSLLFTDDTNGVIYRVSYTGGKQ